jgi:hypothetical protein
MLGTRQVSRKSFTLPKLIWLDGLLTVFGNNEAPCLRQSPPATHANYAAGLKCS